MKGDIAVQFGTLQICRSLHTESRRAAIELARALAARTDELFAEVRNVTKRKATAPHDLVRTRYSLSFKIDKATGLPLPVLNTDPNNPADRADGKQTALEMLDKLIAAQAQARAGAAPAPPIPTGPTLQEAVDDYARSAAPHLLGGSIESSQSRRCQLR